VTNQAANWKTPCAVNQYGFWPLGQLCSCVMMEMPKTKSKKRTSAKRYETSEANVRILQRFYY